MANTKLSAVVSINTLVAGDEVIVTQAAGGPTTSRITKPNFLEHILQLSITESSHGFSAKDAVGNDGTNWVKADATVGAGLVDALGLAVTITSGSIFILALPGLHTITSHGFTLGWNYLSETAGAISTSIPAIGARIQPVLFAIDANTVLIAPQAGVA